MQVLPGSSERYCLCLVAYHVSYSFLFSTEIDVCLGCAQTSNHPSAILVFSQLSFQAKTTVLVFTLFSANSQKKFFFFFSVKGFLCLQRKFHEKTRERNFLSDLQRSEKLGNRRHAIPRNPSPRPAIHETNGRGNNGAVRRTSSLGDGS